MCQSAIHSLCPTTSLPGLTCSLCPPHPRACSKGQPLGTCQSCTCLPCLPGCSPWKHRHSSCPHFPNLSLSPALSRHDPTGALCAVLCSCLLGIVSHTLLFQSMSVTSSAAGLAKAAQQCKVSVQTGFCSIRPCENFKGRGGTWVVQI